MTQLKHCPVCGGKHRRESAYKECVRKHNPEMNSWPDPKKKK